MDLNYRNTNLFPSIVHEFTINDFDKYKSELLDYAYNLKKQDSQGRKLSNVGGWQSEGFDINDNYDVLHNLLINSVPKIPTITDGVEINIFAWVNINKTGDFNQKHDHPWSELSGVLWIQSPDNCGNIVFESPHSFVGNKEICSYKQNFKEETNAFLTYYYNTYEGGMLIFPSYLTHWVQPNKSKDDRISVSFNINMSNVRDNG